MEGDLGIRENTDTPIDLDNRFVTTVQCKMETHKNQWQPGPWQ